MSDIILTPLVVPATLDADDAGDFHALGALSRQICDEHVGLPDLSPSAAEMLPDWQDSTDSLDVGIVARIDGEVAGIATMSYAQEAEADTAEFDILVPRAQEGRGVEQVLLRAAEADAAARGRHTLQLWTLHRPIEAAHMLTPRTGWGRIPSTTLSDAVQAEGYSLEQVERNSELDLRGDPVRIERSLADAQQHAGPDYRIHAWNLPTPPELRDGYAAVLARLSTDAPSGDMEFVAEQWDADRVVRRDARLTGAGQLVSVVAVEHVPTGEIVAYNELLIASDRSATTHQFGTLVAAHHRGHRLGTIVKCANLLRWRELVPESPAVSTFNAEENRPMLDINESIGFVPVSYAGAWQKKV